MIADIRGYTKYTEEHGDEAGAELVRRFTDLVSEVVSTREGLLLELRGDEALVVFVSARKALRAAVDLQERFASEKLPRGIGIGLDAGEAIPVGDGYRGTAPISPPGYVPRLRPARRSRRRRSSTSQQRWMASRTSMRGICG